MGGLVRISTGKAIQRRGPGDSVNRRTLKTEKLLSSSPSQKSAPMVVVVYAFPCITSYDLVDASDIFYLFCSGEGNGKSEVPGRAEVGFSF